MSPTLVLALLLGPFSIALAAFGGVIGYMLAQRRYLELFKNSQLDQAAAQSSLAELHDVASKLTNRVTQHNDRVEGIEQALLASGESPDNVAAAVAGFREANEKLQADLSATRRELDEQTKKFKRHQREARTDELTSLLNRRAFHETLQTLVKDPRSGQDVGGLLLIELDHFKECNDRYGHVVGDKILQQMARIIRDNLIGLDASAARYAGAQFAVIFFKGSLDVVKKVMGDIRRAAEKSKFDDGAAQIAMTLSGGLVMKQPGMSDQELEAGADKALCAAKSAGHNRSYYFRGKECLLLEPEAPPAKPQGKEQLKQKGPAASDQPPRVASQSAPVRMPASVPPANTPTALAATPPASSSAVDPKDRREHRRQACNGIYRVAPHLPGTTPSLESFSNVRLMDVSLGGCALILFSQPESKSYVVALNKPDGTVYLVAEVVRVTKGQPESGKEVFVAGCKFTGRIAAPSSQLEVQRA